MVNITEQKRNKALFLMSISSSSASHTFILTVYNLNMYSDGPKTICANVLIIHSFNKYLFLHYTYRATVDVAGDTQNKWIQVNELVLMTILSLWLFYILFSLNHRLLPSKSHGRTIMEDSVLKYILSAEENNFKRIFIQVLIGYVSKAKISE